MNEGRGRNKRIDREEVRSLFGEGLSDKEISEKLCCSPATIKEIRLNELDLGRGQKTPPKISRSKIKLFFEEGLSDEEISEKLYCSPATVKQIRAGELGLKRRGDYRSQDVLIEKIEELSKERDGVPLRPKNSSLKEASEKFFGSWPKALGNAHIWQSLNKTLFYYSFNIEDISEKIGDFYHTYVRSIGLQGKSKEVALAASIYLVFRHERVPITTEEAIEVTEKLSPRSCNIDKGQISSSIGDLRQEHGLRKIIIKLADVTNKYLKRLDISSTTRKKAREIANQLDNEVNISGKSKKSLAAAIIYIAPKITCSEKKELTQKEIANLCEVSEVTLRSNYKWILDELDFDI